MADPGFDLSSATPVQDSGDSGFDLSSAKPESEFEDDSAIAPLPTRFQQINRAAEQALDPRNNPVYGATQAALKFGAGTAAFLLKGLRSTWDLATSPKGGKVYDANKDMRGIDQAMDYQPDTPYGQLFSSAIDAGGSWPGKLADSAGELVTKKTGSRGWGAATSFGLQAAPVVLGAKYASSSGRVAPGMSAPAAEALARKYVSNGLGLDWDTLSANVQKKLTALAATGSDFSHLDAPAVARQSRLDRLRIPYTRGDVTRDAAQVTREETLSKSEKAGAPIREVRAGQDEALHNNLATLRDATGAMAETREGVGTSVQDLALRKKEAVSQANYRKLYADARATDPEATVSVQPMADLLSSNPEIQHLGFVKTWLGKAGLKVGEDGAIEGDPAIRLDQLDDLRQKAVKIARNGGTEGMYAGEAISAIDKAFEGVPAAAKAWRTARDAFKAHKMEFEDTGAVAKQVGMKSRVDRTTALADTFDRFISGSADDIRNIQKSLTTGGDVKTQAAGAQAWRDLQGATLDYLKEKAVGKRGIEGDTSTEAGKRAFESGKPLQQFNSSFRDAYAELKKDGKIDAIFSPEQVAQLEDIYAAVGDVRTRPAARISGSPTAANAVAMLEDMSHKHLVESVPVVGKPVAAAARWYAQVRKERRAQREAATTPLDEEAQRAADAARRERVWGRIFRYGAAPAMGADEEGNPRPGPNQFARGGLVQRFGEGGVALQKAVKKIAETLEEVKARHAVEQQQAKAPVPGMFSVLDKTLETAPFESGPPEQWESYAKPGRMFSREGVDFPLKKAELADTKLPRLFAAIKALNETPTLAGPKPPTPRDNYLAWASDVAARHPNLNFDPAAHQDPIDFFHANSQAFDQMRQANAEDPDWLALNHHHAQSVNDPAEFGGVAAPAGPVDPFGPEALSAAGFSRRSVPKDKLLAWLRANRMDIKNSSGDSYGDYSPPWLKQGNHPHTSDATTVVDPLDPEVANTIRKYSGHSISGVRPLSWNRSYGVNNPDTGALGRLGLEFQSDLDSTAGEKLVRPGPEAVNHNQFIIDSPLTQPRVRREAQNQQPNMTNWREMATDELEVPEGYSSRRRGYGPLEAANDSTQRHPPVYEGVPFKNMDYIGLELRKLLAQMPDRGEHFLSTGSGLDNVNAYARGTPREAVNNFGIKRSRGMFSVYGDPETSLQTVPSDWDRKTQGKHPEADKNIPPNSGIVPSRLHELGRPYGMDYSPTAPVGLAPGAEHEPLQDLPVAPHPDPLYNADQLRSDLYGVRGMRAGKPVTAGDYAKRQVDLLKQHIAANEPATTASIRSQMYGTPGEDWKPPEPQVLRHDLNKEKVAETASALHKMQSKYLENIRKANYEGLIDREYHEARKVASNIAAAAERMTSPSWRTPAAKLPGPISLKKNMNRLEEINQLALERLAERVPIVQAENEAIKARNAALPPPPKITKPTISASDSVLDKIRRAGVGLYTLPAAAMGLDAMRQQYAQQDQPQFARGGIVQRFGEGGVALQKAVKKLAESIEQIKARRALEQQQAKAPTEGQFSTLDKVIQESPDFSTPEQWQNYLSNQRAFKREGVTFPLKDEELGFTGTRKLLQTLKDRVQPPAVKIHPAHRELAAFAASPENFKPALSPYEKALQDFRDWMEPNRGALGIGDRQIDDPSHLYETVGNIEPMPTWRHGGDNQLWNQFYEHYNNVQNAAGQGGATPPDPFSPAKLAEHNLTPDKVSKNDLLAWLRANRPAVVGSTRQEHPSNRAPWLQNPDFPYREELSTIKNHWDPNVTPQIRAYTSHYGADPLSWARLTDVATPSGGKGSVINEIQSDFHGKAGDRVATPLPEVTDWAKNLPSFVPEDVRINIEGSRSLKERTLKTEDPKEAPVGMKIRRVGYGPLSEVEHPAPNTVRKMYEGVPLQGLEGYPPFEIRRAFADAANRDSDFLGVVSGKDQKDIYGDRMGKNWTEAMQAVYGTPETPGFYEKPLQKLASQYGLPFTREHLMGHDRPRHMPEPIDVQDDTSFDPAPVRAAKGLPDDAPVTMGDYALHQMHEARNQLHAATPDVDPDATLHTRMRAADALNSDEAYSAYNAPGAFSGHLSDKINHMMYDIDAAENAGALPPDWHDIASRHRNAIQQELGKITQYGNSKAWPGEATLKGHIDELASIHQQVLPKIAEYNERARNPPKGVEIHRPAVLMDAAARERIRRIGVPLFSAAGAALGLNGMDDPDRQGFARGGPVRGYYGGGMAAAGDKLTAEEIAGNARPGFLKRLGAGAESDWTYMGKDGKPHFAGTGDARGQQTGIRLMEDFGGMPIGMAGLADIATRGYFNKALRNENPVSEAAAKGLGWSEQHQLAGLRIEKAVRDKYGIPDADGWYEKIADMTGNVLGQIPTGETTLLGTLSRLARLSKIPGAAASASRLTKAVRGISPVVHNALRPAAAAVDFFGPTIKGPLHPSSYLWATGMGAAMDKGTEMLTPDDDHDQPQQDINEVAARTMDDVRDRVHMHHIPDFVHARVPTNFAEGGPVSGGGSPLADGMSNLLDMAGRLGKLADKAYPHVAKQLKSPLSPKPKPKGS